MRLCFVSILTAVLGLCLGCQPEADVAREVEPVVEAEVDMPSVPSEDERTNVSAGDAMAAGDGSAAKAVDLDPPPEAAGVSLPEALQQVTAGTAILLDVRSDEEWDEKHFAQAQHIGIDKISEDAAAACAGLDKDKLVLCH